MEAYETIKKILNEGGKCLLIENGRPLGVVLTLSEFNKMGGQAKPEEPAKPTVPAANLEDINLEELDIGDLPF